MIKKTVISIFCFLFSFSFSQTTPFFAWPMDTPHVLTGNYGELRPNHFHMGLDFSTGGKINFPVYAVADGYVSRIKVSSGGYGKALYITHDRNKLSLYAHLTTYAGALAAAVKNEQYAKQSYEVEFFPKKDELRVKKGELIGYSGNSGNSSGPHLHFELRDATTEVPLNPLEIYAIKDTIKPMVDHIAFYNLADTMAPAVLKIIKVENKRDSLFIKKDTVLLHHQAIGFAFSGLDRFVHRGNPNVPFSARLYLDSQLIYTHTLHNISFDDQRYVNEFSETIHKIKFQKCFLPTLYPASIYSNCLNKGIITVTDTGCHHLRMMVSDEQGNNNTLQFYIKNLPGAAPPVRTAQGKTISCGSDASWTANGLRLFIPARALYRSYAVSVRNALETSGSFTVVPASANLNAPFFMALKIPSKFLMHKDKLVLHNGPAYYVPLAERDSLFCSAYNFGTFRLMADTLAPNIKTQLGPKKIKRVKKFSIFSFVVRDNMSGISRYSLFVNGVWALAEYDAKNNLLTYFFDELTPEGNLDFKLAAEDRSGNKTLFEYTLKR